MEFFRYILGTPRRDTKQSGPEQSILSQYPVFGFIALLVMFLLTQSRVLYYGACEQGEFEPNFHRYQVVSDGTPYCYVVYVPPTYDPAMEWPLVVFLHGRGEGGFDGYAHTTVGIGTSIRNYPDQFPCLVVMPQFPWNGTYDEWFAVADAAIEDVKLRYAVDPDRVSLTGLSFGGENTWRYVADRPGVFSALMPIASGVDPSWNPNDFLGIPIWTFHGAQDFVAPPQPLRDWVQAIDDAGGDIRYTEYPEFTHFIWNFVYQDAENINWLIEQVRD